MSKLEKYFSGFDMVVFVIKWYIKGVKLEQIIFWKFHNIIRFLAIRKMELTEKTDGR